MKREEVLGLILIFIANFLLLFSLSLFLWEEDFFHLRTVAYLEKALLAVEGSPPRLENVGFVYPPLPVYFLIPLKNLPLAQGLAGALSFLFIVFLARKLGGKTLALLSLPASLPFFYLGTLAFDKLLAYTFIATATFLLLLYLRERFSLYLFSGGLLYGITFFIDFSTFSLLPFYFFSFLLLKESPSKKLSLIVVFLFPLIFFSSFYAFVNYTFKGDPLYFLREHVPTLSSLLSYEITPRLHHLVVIAWYLLGIFLVKNYKVLYLVPVFYLLSLFYFNPVRELTDFGISPLFIFIPFALLSLESSLKRVNAYLLTLMLILNGAFLFSYDANERNFLRALLGKPFEQNLSYYKEVANVLNNLEGEILMDDEGLYPTVVFVKELRRLLLPYRSEYYTYLLSPGGKVDFAVVKTFYEKDDLYALYKESVRDLLRGCKYYGEVRDVKIFSCSHGSIGPFGRLPLTGNGLLSPVPFRTEFTKGGASI